MSGVRERAGTIGGGICALVIIVVVLNAFFKFAAEYTESGPFADILDLLAQIGPVSLALLGGGLVIALGFLVQLLTGSSGSF